MSRIRIAMNLLWCVPGVGGSEEYLVRQLLGLADIEHDYNVEVFAPRGFSQRQPRIAALYTVHEASNDCSRRVVRIWIEHTWLAKKDSWIFFSASRRRHPSAPWEQEDAVDNS
jgi:hypothetical protein